MKKHIGFIFLSLFCMSGIALASHFTDLSIVLSNTGSGACTLTKEIRVCGSLKYNNRIPDELPADGSLHRFKLEKTICDYKNDIDLEYACGLGKIVRIRITSGPIWKKSHCEECDPKSFTRGYLNYSLLPETNNVFVKAIKIRKPYWNHNSGGTRHGGNLHLDISH